jgi:ribonuclease Y
MAAEMGTDIKAAKRCGLLHDIGKAVDQEVEGHHAIISAKICRKYNESNAITEAIENHHNDDLTQASPLSVILHAANSLSANRPGARREILETYVKRLGTMESLVNEFDGVDSAFVIQAGREIRALVKPEGVSDDQVTSLSNEIAFKLRKELTFPGQVKVTVLRDSQHVAYAK